MGDRGQPPTPTAILKLRGSRLVKEREKNREPAPSRGKPERPSTITKVARDIWDSLTGLLDDMGVLTQIDGGQLERYCLMFAQWRQMQRISQKLSKTDDALIVGLRNDETRSVVRNVWSEFHRLDAALKQIEMQFGLTPAARARLSCLVSSDGPAKDDRESMFFSGAG